MIKLPYSALSLLNNSGGFILGAIGCWSSGLSAGVHTGARATDLWLIPLVNPIV